MIRRIRITSLITAAVLSFFVVPESTLSLSLSIQASLSQSNSNSLSNRDDEFVQNEIDQRPHEQRSKGPRSARRLNHGFRYLFRNESHLHCDVTAFDYLTEYYSTSEILEMNRTFPPLLDLNVSRHIHPKILFLKQTIMKNDSKEIPHMQVPPQYFGARLEKTIAPRHAFLVYKNLPHGPSLLKEEVDGTSKHVNRFYDFLVSCRQTKRFCALCNEWRKEQKQQRKLEEKSSYPKGSKHHIEAITSKEIEAFDFVFGRGLMAATRNDMVNDSNNWSLQHINITSTEVLTLLIEHGANPLERDVRGTTLLHWAAGTGNLETFRALLPRFPNGILEQSERDGSTVLHWACAGADGRAFGTGGHYHLCQYILSQCEKSRACAKDVVNQRTKDGNSPLMWASWSGSLDCVKLMVRNRAKSDLCNRNGCTVAHWAASGGSLDVCQYLADVVGVNFFVSNLGGNTPLTHAVAFGRVDVVKWLRECAVKLEDSDDIIAKQLAADFVNWNQEQSGDDLRREQVLDLFDDDNWES